MRALKFSGIWLPDSSVLIDRICNFTELISHTFHTLNRLVARVNLLSCILYHFLVTAVMICGGLVMYPIGWDNREVQESCGKSANVYNLGEYRRQTFFQGISRSSTRRRSTSPISTRFPATSSIVENAAANVRAVSLGAILPVTRYRKSNVTLRYISGLLLLQM